MNRAAPSCWRFGRNRRGIDRGTQHNTELMAEGIQYLPVVWSAYGRPHPDASRVLLTLARSTARRRGEASYRGLARRWAYRITAGIWLLAANMIFSCWPASTAAGASSIRRIGGAGGIGWGQSQRAMVKVAFTRLS